MLPREHHKSHFYTQKHENEIHLKCICTLGLILYYRLFSFLLPSSVRSADMCMTMMGLNSSSLWAESAVGSSYHRKDV